MWLVEAIDVIAGGRLDAYGIEPRDPDGLPGIVAAPLLHGGWDHLIANTLPFVALGAIIALSGVARLGVVILVTAVVGGLGTWLTAPANTVHIGASGVVFGFATYLAVRGLYARNALQIAVGVLVVLVLGTTLAQGLVPQEGISWQGHLFGAIGGVVAARLLHGSGDAPVTDSRKLG